MVSDEVLVKQLYLFLVFIGVGFQILKLLEILLIELLLACLYFLAEIVPKLNVERFIFILSLDVLLFEM